MSATLVLLGGAFTRPDGTASEGSGVATLSAIVRNGTEEIVPEPLQLTLDGLGRVCTLALFPFILSANDDAGSVPDDTTYEFDLTIDSTPFETFVATISYLATAVDANCQTTDGSNLVTLGNFLASPPLVGQAISGAGIPPSSTVTAYNVRVDAACTTTEGSPAVGDQAITGTETGATVTGPGIPPGSTVTLPVQGQGFTLSADATATSTGMATLTLAAIPPGDTPAASPTPNTVLISNAATASAAEVALTLGGAVDLGALIPSS